MCHWLRDFFVGFRQQIVCNIGKPWLWYLQRLNKNLVLYFLPCNEGILYSNILIKIVKKTTTKYLLKKKLI